VARAQEDDAQLGALLATLTDSGLYDAIVVDTPPRTAAAVKACLPLAATMLVPVMASISDIAPVFDMLREVHAPVDTRVVVNCMPQSRKYMGEIWEALCRLPIPVCNQALTQRLAIRRAQALQVPVTIYEPAGTAAFEVRALGAEVWGHAQQQIKSA